MGRSVFGCRQILLLGLLIIASLKFNQTYNDPKENPRVILPRVHTQFVANLCVKPFTPLLAFDSPLFPNARLLAYHKCGLRKFPKSKYWNVTHKVLRNVGREGHSWLYFMLYDYKYYPADWYVTLQGATEQMNPTRLTHLIESNGETVATSLGWCMKLHWRYYIDNTGEEFGEITWKELCDLVSSMARMPCMETSMFRTGQLLLPKKSIDNLLTKREDMLVDFYKRLDWHSNPSFGWALEVIWGTLFANASDAPHDDPYLKCNFHLRSFGGQKMTWPIP